MAGVGRVSGHGFAFYGIVECRIVGQGFGCYDTISYHSGRQIDFCILGGVLGHILRYTAPVAFMDDETDLKIVLVILILVK